MPKKVRILIATAVVVAMTPALYAWDHAGHMTTAAIAFAEIEKTRPELIDRIGALLLAHPDLAPFWVAAGDARGKERTRLMFIEGARWPDDSKNMPEDRPSWHMARWAIVADDAPPEARARAEARGDKYKGQALEALALMFAELASPETTPAHRARALCWVLHIMGDIHQPLHVGDHFTEQYPEGNTAGSLSYVADPLGDSTIPLHMLWDSNTMGDTTLENIDRNAQELVKKYPRSSFSELAPPDTPDDFENWARESYEVATDFAFGYGLETAADDPDQTPDELLQNMMKFVLEGISPVEEAPELPAEYWEQLQEFAHARITLAGYRIADLILSAADQIVAEEEYVAAAHEKY